MALFSDATRFSPTVVSGDISVNSKPSSSPEVGPGTYSPRSPRVKAFGQCNHVFDPSQSRRANMDPHSNSPRHSRSKSLGRERDHAGGVVRDGVWFTQSLSNARDTVPGPGAYEGPIVPEYLDVPVGMRSHITGLSSSSGLLMSSSRSHSSFGVVTSNMGSSSKRICNLNNVVVKDGIVFLRSDKQGDRDHSLGPGAYSGMHSPTGSPMLKKSFNMRAKAGNDLAQTAELIRSNSFSGTSSARAMLVSSPRGDSRSPGRGRGPEQQVPTPESSLEYYDATRQQQQEQRQRTRGRSGSPARRPTAGARSKSPRGREARQLEHGEGRMLQGQHPTAAGSAPRQLRSSSPPRRRRGSSAAGTGARRRSKSPRGRESTATMLRAIPRDVQDHQSLSIVTTSSASGQDRAARSLSPYNALKFSHVPTAGYGQQDSSSGFKKRRTLKKKKKKVKSKSCSPRRGLSVDEDDHRHQQQQGSENYTSTGEMLLHQGHQIDRRMVPAGMAVDGNGQYTGGEVPPLPSFEQRFLSPGGAAAAQRICSPKHALKSELEPYYQMGLASPPPHDFAG